MKIIKKNSKYGEYRIELLIESETDNILGFCIAYSKSVSGKIEVLFVDEKYRRNGFGLKLMNSAVEWFKVKKIDEIELTVVYGNEAVSFYEKLGFYPRSIIMAISHNDSMGEMSGSFVSKMIHILLNYM